MNTIFYVIKINDTLIRSVIDLLRFIANPNEKRTAHITVRGPYKKTQKFSLSNRIIESAKIRVNSIGNFFSERQNTVFFKCESDELRKVWFKHGYGYNPHITIYDAEDSNYARAIYSIISGLHFSFSFPSSELIPLFVHKGQTDLDLALDVDIDLLNNFLNQNMDINEIRYMGNTERILLLERLCSFLPNLHS